MGAGSHPAPHLTFDLWDGQIYLSITQELKKCLNAYLSCLIHEELLTIGREA